MEIIVLNGTSRTTLFVDLFEEDTLVHVVAIVRKDDLSYETRSIDIPKTKNQILADALKGGKVG